MSGPKDLVSIIVPVHNGARFLAESLASAEGQVGVAVEILVVDDGSDDGSGDIARVRPGIRVVRKESGGVGAARNTGLEQARGEFISFLDADDLWHAPKTARQMAALRADPAAGGVLCRFRNFLDPVHPPPEGIEVKRFLEEKTGSMPSLITLLARRETMERVGLFRIDLATGEDLDWFARAGDLGISFGPIPEILVERRLHNANLSYLSPRDRGHLIDIMRASIERKRAAGLDTREMGAEQEATGRARGTEGGE
jgi:glycosyltransferase involved in cell wall biosynthesis